MKLASFSSKQYWPLSLGIVILFFLLYFSFTSQTQDPVRSLRFLILAGSCGLLWGTSIWRHKKLMIPRTPPFHKVFGAIWIMLILWEGIGISQSINVQEGVFELARRILLGLFFVWLWLAFSSKRISISVLATGLSLLALLQSSLGICQFHFSLFLEIPPMGVEAPFGTMANRNLFASSLVILLPFCLYQIFEESPRNQVLGISSLLFSLYAIFLSQTRSAWLATVMFMIFVFIGLVLLSKKQYPSIQKRGLFLAGILVFGIALAMAVQPKLRKQASTRIGEIFTYEESSQSSIKERLEVWKLSLSLWKDKPILGIGKGNWKIEIPGKGFQAGRATQGDAVYLRAHNDYIQQLSETGALGVLLFVGMWGMVLTVAWKKIIHTDSLQDFLLSILVLAGMLAFLVDAFFSFPHERSFHMCITMVFWAISLRVDESQHMVPLKTHFIILPFILSCLLSVYAWQRYRSLSYIKSSVQANYTGKIDQGITYAKQAKSPWVNIDELCNPYDLTIGYAYGAKKQNGIALQHFRKGLLRHPHHVPLLFNLAQLLEQSSADEAKENYQHALHIAPKHEPSLRGLGIIYVREKNYPEALKFLSKVDTTQDENTRKLVQAIKKRTSE